MNSQSRWARLLSEGVVVIVSILIAFSIDAWWARRQAIAVERELLTRLQATFAEHRELLTERIAGIEGDRSLARSFITMTPEEAEGVPPDSTYALLQALWRPGSNDANARTILATLDAGRMSLVSDPALLTALAEWQNLIGTLERRAIAANQLELDVMTALSRHAELQLFLAFSGEYSDLPGSALRKVREDNEVMASAARMVFVHAVQLLYLRQTEAAASEVLGLIDAHLE